MNKYQKLLQKLYNMHRLQFFKYDLDNVLKLAQAFGNPQNSFQAVHITGTNGKGSVTFKIAQSLTKNNFKTGMFISPHITTFRERVQIDGQYIEEDYIVQWLEDCFKISERLNLQNSFFEILTVLAFNYFKDNKIDIGCIEVGIGGRLDCTNILTNKLLSIITSIDKDHQNILGDTLQEILTEKCGIIQQNVPVLIGPNIPNKHIVQNFCQKLNCDLTEIQIGNDQQDFKYINKQIAIKALDIMQKQLNIKLDIDDITLSKNLPCRMELVNKELQKNINIPEKVDIYMDVGHNLQGIQYMFQQQKFDKKPILVYGTSKLKLFPEILQFLSNKIEKIYLVQAKGPKKTDVQILKDIAKENNMSVEIIAEGDIQKTLKEIFEVQKLFDHSIVICGTFFIMEEARDYFGYNDPKDFVFLNEIRNYQQCLIFKQIQKIIMKYVKMNMMNCQYVLRYMEEMITYVKRSINQDLMLV